MELEKEYALTGVTLIDGNGGNPVKDTVVVVKNGVIDQVGDRRSVKINDDIQMVDMSGYYLMPGLVDCNVHFVGVSSGSPLDWILESNHLQATRTVSEVRKVLEAGFTTAVSCGSRYDIYLKKAIEEGTIVGPRIRSCGLLLGRSRGSDDPTRRDLYDIPDEWAQQGDPVAQRVDGVEEIRKAVRQRLSQDVDHIKFVATGGGVWEKDRSEDMHYSREEMKTIVEEAHMVRLGVMCHAENLQAIRTCVELGVEIIEHGHTEEGCELDGVLCKEMAEKNISIVPTLSVNFVGEWAVEKIPEHAINGWKRAIENGVKILLGADAYAAPITPYGEFNIGEIKLLVDILGMTPLEAITSGTKYGAEACGIGGTVGTIEKGKSADLLVVKGDPTRNIDILLDKENIKYIMKEGNLVIEH